MSGCCENKHFDGLSESYRRALWAVIIINGLMFIVEMYAGATSGSQSLKADALDFAGDTATYALSLAVLGSTIRTRAYASLFKGVSLALIAFSVLTMTALRIMGGVLPEANTMGIIGFVALSANLASVFILLKWRDGDSNVRSVWLCSRNDAIGNVAVIAASGAVAYTQSPWPDLIVAFVLAGLFLKSATSISLQAMKELKDDIHSSSVSTGRTQ